MSEAKPNPIVPSNREEKLVKVEPIENSSQPIATSNTSESEPISSAATTMSTLEPSDEQTNSSQQQSNNIDWHKIAHKLREHNRKLLKQVFKLEQELAESKNVLEQQTERSQNTDTLIAQQAKELNHSQEEVARLLHQIEAFQQEAQNQKLLMESMSKQNKHRNNK